MPFESNFRRKSVNDSKDDFPVKIKGAEIRDSDDFHLHCDGNVYTLTIPRVCEEDAGQFTVTASNSTGKATSSARLVVTGIHDKKLFP